MRAKKSGRERQSMMAADVETKRNSRSRYDKVRLQWHDRRGCSPDEYEGMILDARGI